MANFGKWEWGWDKEATTSPCPSLIPRPSPAPVFDCLQNAKEVEEGLVNLTHVIRGTHSITILVGKTSLPL